MKNRFALATIMMLALLFVLSLSQAQAYPWFARRLVDNCNKCHVSFPKTNDYGWYVKTTGYELPKMDYTGLEESPVKRFFRYFPAAVRFKVDAINSNPSSMEGDVNIRLAQFISGGSIFNNSVSWWLHKHLVENNEFEKPFEGLPHEMWGQYNLHFGKSNVNRLSLRYGMSELPLRFSPSKTMLSEFEYAIYNAMMGGSSLMLSMPQYGVGIKGLRLGGDNFNEVKSTLDVAFFNGVGDFSSSDFTQVFGRVGTSLGKTMVGAFTIFGSRELPMAMDDHADGDHADEPGHAEAEPAAMTVDNGYLRLGLDFDSNVTATINIYGLAMVARDNNPLALAEANSGKFYGGFLGLDYCPTEKLMFSWRYDLVRFNGLPAADEHLDEHGDEHSEDPMDGGMDMDADAHGATGGGHAHGDMVNSDTDAMVFGLQFLPLRNYYQVRLTTEYRHGFGGQDNKLIAGLQFAF